MAFAPDERSLWLATHVLPHEPALRGWLTRTTRLGEDRIDDLVQETYAILATRAEVASIRNVRAYVFQVARSILLQDLRRARVVGIGSLADLEQFHRAADAPSPEQEVMARDELARVGDAIAALPQQARRAFQLRRVEGLSQREVAAALGLSENTVEKHIMRAIKSLMLQFGRGGRAAPDASMRRVEGCSYADDQPRARADC